MKNIGKRLNHEIKIIILNTYIYIYIYMYKFIIMFYSLHRSALLCEMEQRLKELNPESSGSNAGAIALRRSLP